MAATIPGEFADRSPLYPTPTASPVASRPTVDLPLTQSVSEDQRLLHQLGKGDRTALEEIARLHQRAVYGFLRARLLEPADAEDLCQDVFLRCYSGKVRFERAPQLRPWLIGIARNVLREHIRSRIRSKEVAWTEMCLELDAATADQPQQHAAAEHLPDCMKALGPSARQALDMRYGTSLTLSEIGARLRRSEGAAKLLLFRARQALRNCLDLRVRQSDTE